MRNFVAVTSTARSRNLSSGIKILMESFLPWAEPIAHLDSVDEHAATRKLGVPGGIVFGIKQWRRHGGSYVDQSGADHYHP
jgi:hypothetical protein